MDWVNTLPIIFVIGTFAVMFGNLLYESLRTAYTHRQYQCPAPCCEEE